MESDPSNNTIDVSKNIWTEEHTNIIKYVCAHTNLTPEAAWRGLHVHKGDYKKVIDVANAFQLINIVMRQTTYTSEEALGRLRAHKGDPISVIKEFMGSGAKFVDGKEKSTNQMIFSEIRTFMDTVNIGYNDRKRKANQLSRIREYYKK